MNEILKHALVWDAHAGLFPSPEMDLNTLEDWRNYGVNYLSINVGFDVMSRDETLATLAAYRRWLQAHSDRFLLAGTFADIDKAQRSGHLAVSFDIEGMNALGGDINMVEVYHTLGVRQMLFAYNLNNAAAGGCHDTDIALTSFGIGVLAEMNRVGMIVDASHASYRTSMDLIERSRAPVVFSHSNPASVWPHQRNITDEQIKACAAKGGVIGLNGLAIFVGDNDTRSESLLCHLLRLIDIAGAAHVGLGFDYTPDITVDLGAILRARPDYWPAGQQYDTPNIGHSGPSKIPDLVKGLQAHGLSEPEIVGILGGNFARIAKESWATEAHYGQGVYMTHQTRVGIKIGVLVPFANTNLEPDLMLMCPPDCTMHFQRIGGYDANKIPSSDQMAELGTFDISNDIAMIAGARPDIVLYGCTSATLTHGPDFDRDLAMKIETGSGAVSFTAAGSLVSAIKALNIQRVGFSSPYVGEINEQAVTFLEQSGIETVKRADIGRDLGCYGQGDLTPDEVYHLALKADDPKAEAIVLSCTDMRSVEMIEKIEAVLDKPVVTSNQAMMFCLYRKFGLPRHPSLPGRLFSRL